MKRILCVVAAAVAVVALPFIFRQRPDAGDWRPGDPEVVIITPQSESIRHEFAIGFSKWHMEKYGRPARVDWRVIGGTSEIMRYMESEYIGSMKGWWEREGNRWPAAAGSYMLSAKADSDDPVLNAVRDAFRGNDDPDIASAQVDLFFGGGAYDQGKSEREGMSVPAWPTEDDIPIGLVRDERGVELFPREISGEVLRDDVFYGNVLCTFGICYNTDRLADLAIVDPPNSWRALADPRLFGQVAVSDPTKSGSLAKAFELVVQQTMTSHMHSLGYAEADIDRLEKLVADGASGDEIEKYNADVADAWIEGINLVRLIGANARYFTDGAGKVTIDIGNGAAAAGICIDYYGRFQSEFAVTADGRTHMEFVTPVGGSCVSADPVSLLRGAPNRETAVHFIEYLLCEDGQKLWNYRVGTKGGPVKYPIRRLPIRRDFYPSDDPVFNEKAKAHVPNYSDDLASPSVNPYALANTFTYRPRWTGRHFGIQRDIIRAMCLDSSDELRAAWKAINANGGPEANKDAMARLMKMPETPFPLTWQSAVNDIKNVSRLEYMRLWTSEFRRNYREAAALANLALVTPITK